MPDSVSSPVASDSPLIALRDDGTASLSAWTSALETYLAADPAPDAADAWISAAAAAIASSGKLADSLAFLRWRIERAAPGSRDAAYWRAAADQAAKSDGTLLSMVYDAGFGQRIAPRECLRRLELIASLKRGAKCFHRIYGFGVVRDATTWRENNANVTGVIVDFHGRGEQRFPVKSAAEKLVLLSDDHILSWYFLDPAAVREAVASAPETVVERALASFGPLSADDLKARLVSGGIVSADAWSGFFATAKKRLKAAKRVEFPAKKNDPMRLLSETSGFDETWFARLSGERDLANVLKALAEAANAGGSHTDAQKAVLADRAAFLIRGAPAKQPWLRLLAAMHAASLGLPETCGWKRAAEEMGDPAALAEALAHLNSKDVRPALEFLWKDDAEKARAAMEGAAGLVYAPTFGEIAKMLLDHEAADNLRAALSDAFARKSVQVEWLLWTLRNPKTAREWRLPTATDMAGIILDELEKDYMGERLKAQKNLRERFEKPEWLKATFEGWNREKQVEFFRRLNRSPAWRGGDRQKLQVDLLKLYPDLADALQETSAPKDAPKDVTSARSYRERQAALKKVKEEDLPQNRHEIQIARSYGDLSENYEYKAAKDMEAVLLARIAEMEKQLKLVRPVDFADFPCDAAGPGTRVTIAHADGSEETFTILGEWDQVPEKKIISSASGLAIALKGHAAGDEVAVPAADGEETCRVARVEPLDAETLAWVK